MEKYREFVFHIENTKFTVLSDQSTHRTGFFALPPKYKRLHFHAYHELFYVSNGTLLLQFEDREQTFSKDDLVIISPGVRHCSRATAPASGRYNLNFQMEKLSVKTGFSLYDALQTAFSQDCISLSDANQLRQILENIVVDIIQDNERMLSVHFHQLIITLLDRLAPEAQQPATEPVMSDSNMIRLYKLQQLISNTYDQDLTLHHIAETLFLSTRQASRIIQQYYGCTFGELVTRLRMQAAIDLLANTDMTILDIASHVGYSSTKGFYTHFKKRYQCLPTEYRRLHRPVRESEPQSVQTASPAADSPCAPR